MGSNFLFWEVAKFGGQTSALGGVAILTQEGEVVQVGQVLAILEQE